MSVRGVQMSAGGVQMGAGGVQMSTGGVQMGGRGVQMSCSGPRPGGAPAGARTLVCSCPTPGLKKVGGELGTEQLAEGAAEKGRQKRPARCQARTRRHDHTMKTHDLDYWLGQASRLPPTNPLNVPYAVALTEAAQAAKFVDEHWVAEGSRPGLDRFAARLPKATSDEIRSLIVAVQWQQTKLLLLVDPATLELGAAANEIIDELESTIGFVLDDGVEEPADAQYTQIKQFHSQDGQRSSALAQSLRDYSSLAEAIKARILEVDAGFDVALIGRARELADKLALAPALAVNPGEQERERAARNRLLGLLMQKVSLVRTTAAHVFRKSPEIVRRVTSSYERRRRTAARKAAAAAGGGSTPNPVVE